MERLGLAKLLQVLEYDCVEDLHKYMVDTDNLTLELLAADLSEMLCVCMYCGDNLAFIDDGICLDCKSSMPPDNLYAWHYTNPKERYLALFGE